MAHQSRLDNFNVILNEQLFTEQNLATGHAAIFQAKNNLLVRTAFQNALQNSVCLQSNLCLRN